MRLDRDSASSSNVRPINLTLRRTIPQEHRYADIKEQTLSIKKFETDGR